MPKNYKILKKSRIRKKLTPRPKRNLKKKRSVKKMRGGIDFNTYEEHLHTLLKNKDNFQEISIEKIIKYKTAKEKEKKKNTWSLISNFKVFNKSVF